MTNFKWLANFVLATAIATTLPAEPHCPANVASLQFHLVNRHQIVLPVMINHAGPYNFLLDTGTQATILDSSLAAQLDLSRRGGVAVAGYGFHESASYAQLNSLEAGSHGVANLQIVVYDLSKLHSSGLQIVGILGEDFLEHFDMLIDNAHSQLCLDDSGAMRANMTGQHIALAAPDLTQDGNALPGQLIVAASFANGARIVRLKLDSGANAGVLYNPSRYLALGVNRSVSVRGVGANGAQRFFEALPPQDLKIGSLALTNVPFYTVTGIGKDSETSDYDGLLSIGIFRRVFIDHADHFAILEL